VPPSIHPDGDRYTWDGSGKPAEVPADRLLCSVRRLAAACLLVQHWPEEGSRQEAALALGGALGRAGWGEEGADHCVGTVAKAAGDGEAASRARAARDSVRKAGKGSKVTGVPSLTKIIDQDVALRVCEWLGCGKGSTGARGGNADSEGAKDRKQ